MTMAILVVVVVVVETILVGATFKSLANKTRPEW